MRRKTVSGAQEQALSACDGKPRRGDRIELTREVQELAWLVLDGVARSGEVRRLEDLLLASAEARRVYMICVQMDADLFLLLGDKRPLSHAPIGPRAESQAATRAAPPAAPAPCRQTRPNRRRAPKHCGSLLEIHRATSRLDRRRIPRAACETLARRASEGNTLRFLACASG